MVTGRRLFVGACALVVLVSIAAAALAWRAWGDGEGPTLGRDPIAGSAIVTPEQHLFADGIRAVVEVVVDADRVDPASVKVGANFQPYRELRPPRVTRDRNGPIARVTYDYLVGCLTAACLPKGTGRVELGAAAVEYTRRGSPVPDTAEIAIPPLRAAGRIAPAELEQAAIRADLRDLPEPTYRISPRLVQIVALVLAVLFLIAASVLFLRLLPLERWATKLGALRIDRRTDLERALAHVREATSAGDSEEGRRALERLAAELRRSREPGLARDASKLAWSRRVPVEAGVAPLSGEVERLIGENGRVRRR
jgi:hypothetical protein